MPDSAYTPASVNDDVMWRQHIVTLSPQELCAELVDAGTRAVKGEGPPAPAVKITLSSGVVFTGLIWAKGDKGHIVVEGDDGIHTIALNAVAALSLPSIPITREVMTAGRVEAGTANANLTSGHLVTRAQELTADVGVKFTIDPDLKGEQAILVGMERLLSDVATAIAAIRRDRGEDALHNIIDVVWLGRGGRAGTFISKRRLEVRARLEDGRKGRLSRDDLVRAIEAVL